MTDEPQYPRLQRLHEMLAKRIPCDPEDVRADLFNMTMPDFLPRYLNWADRFVPPRPRKVETWQRFLRHGSPETHRKAIYDLAEKIEAGQDLTPFLSDRVHRYGYVGLKTGKGKKPRGPEWDDKDYALNAYETHHLHLDTTRRTEELLYVTFSRDVAFLVMLGNHDSFDDGTLAQAVAEMRVGTFLEFKNVLGPALPRPPGEQNRTQRRGQATVFQAEGQTVMGAMLNEDGTSPLHALHVGKVLDRLRRMDSELGTPGFARERFERKGWDYPTAPVFEWGMRYCDLFFVETTTGAAFIEVPWRR
jgi:hypothetical protein